MIKLFQALKLRLMYKRRNKTFIENAATLQPKHDYIFPWLYNK
jgi:hypothetical protein